VPARLRPTAPIAADAVLVGDPGRALLLAQTLLEEPKMSNHARGLWGYTGQTAAGDRLTVQATGMGGPSAVVVLADLAKLGVRRAIRIGTCAALVPELGPGELLSIGEAHAWSGPGSATGEAARPDPQLAGALADELGEDVRDAVVASLPSLHRGGEPAPVGGGDVADMQTASLFAAGEALGVALAAVLIVTETSTGEQLGEEQAAAAVKRAGVAAKAALSP
jgi:uridine phosphorylase